MRDRRRHHDLSITTGTFTDRRRLHGGRRRPRGLPRILFIELGSLWARFLAVVDPGRSRRKDSA